MSAQGSDKPRLRPGVLPSDELMDELLERFLRVQFPKEAREGKSLGLRPWQSEYIAKPFWEKTGVILQLPPGAGKTLIAQWVMLESLLLFPTKRVLFAVPLRVLAVQLSKDVEAVLDMFNNFITEKFGKEALPLNGRGEEPGFRVGLAEGPGAKIDFSKYRVVVATYEHASGELRKDPRKATPEMHVGLLIVDEVHNIAKQDRGMVIDDLFFFSQARREFSLAKSTMWAVVDRQKVDNRGNSLARYVQGVVEFPVVLGMSGTLEDWVSKRLKDAFPGLFSRILTAEEIMGSAQLTQTLNSARKGAKRIYLDAKKFRTEQVADMALEITRTLLMERVSNMPKPRRLVVFMSTVADAEMAFLHVYSDQTVRGYLKELAKREVVEEVATEAGRATVTSPAYVHPRVELKNDWRKLAERWDRAYAASGHTFGVAAQAPSAPKDADKETSEIVDKLFAGGVYIHHAQISAPKTKEDARTWSDIIQAQLAHHDFAAVFSTSTISVGVNLNSTQIGILGPNTMWTVDQAEQMIGRVGRVDEDAASSFVAVVDSPIYRAPPAVSITAPDTWFVPRLTSVLEFSQNWAARTEQNQADPETMEILRRILEKVEAGQAPTEAEAQLVNSMGPAQSMHNLDIRGFFKPWGSAELHLVDEPGNGVLKKAIEWGVIDGNGTVPPVSVFSLELARQDLKSLPMTMYMLSAFFGAPQGTSPNTWAADPDSWRVVLLWALLNTRLPPRWDNKIRPREKQTKIMEVWEMHSPLIPPKFADRVTQMIALFGEAHESYPGQQDTPSRANADTVMRFGTAFAWCAGLYNSYWIAGKPLDLYEEVLTVMRFLNTLCEDLTPLVRASNALNLATNSLIGAFDRALHFVRSCIYVYNANIRMAEFAGKPPAKQFLDEDLNVDKKYIDKFEVTLEAFYEAAGTPQEERRGGGVMQLLTLIRSSFSSSNMSRANTPLQTPEAPRGPAPQGYASPTQGSARRAERQSPFTRRTPRGAPLQE